MRKIAIVLNVVLLIVVFAGLGIARKSGRTLTYEDFLLPCFGVVLLLSLIDTAPLKSTHNPPQHTGNSRIGGHDR